MKTTWTRILTILIGLHGLAWHSVDERKTETKRPAVVRTGEQMIAAFSPEMAKLTPASFAKAPIEDLQVSEKVMAFKINEFPMIVEWIGKPGRMLRFNNRIFTQNDFATESTFRRAFMAKFGISQKRFSWNSLIFTRAFASISPDLFSDATAIAPEPAAAADEEEETPEQEGIVFNFEGQDDFTQYVYGDETFTDDASLRNTYDGRVFSHVVDLTTGDNLMAMIRYAMLFQGGIAFAMNPAGGFQPGFDLMNNPGGFNPSSVPMPFGN